MMPEFSLGTIIKIFSLLLEVFLGQLMLCKILTPKTFRLRIPCITGIFCVHAIFLLIEEYYLPKLYGFPIFCRTVLYLRFILIINLFCQAFCLFCADAFLSVSDRIQNKIIRFPIIWS